MPVVTLTAGSSVPWTLPGDFPPGGTADMVECIGAGAGASSRFLLSGCPVGGGAGAYAQVTNVVLSGPVQFRIGLGGQGERALTAPIAGSSTLFGASAGASSGAIVAAAGGKVRVGTLTAQFQIGGLGGKTISCIGSIIFAGGNGGNCVSAIGAGSGGGGAGNAVAAGSNGANVPIGQTAGGTGGASIGAGGIGGKATASCTGQAALANLAGGGGGGGGGSGNGTTTTAPGGNGAEAGGGGGGGGSNVAAGSIGGDGGNGVIFVTYTVAAGAVLVASMNLLGVGT